MTNALQKQKKNFLGEKDLDFEIYRSIDRAHAILNRARGLELSQFGITPEHAGVLRTLLDAGGSLTNADISATQIRQSNSVTTLVTRMEKMGLVEKKRAGMGTKIVVSITPKGQDIYKNVPSKSIQMAFSNIKKEDKDRMYKYLLQLIEKGREILGMNQKLPFLT